MAQDKGKRGLANHLALRHGLHSFSRRRARGTTCGACGVQFFARSRLLRMLRHIHRYSPQCRSFLLQYSRPLTRQEADLDEHMRRKARGHGKLDRIPAAQSSVLCFFAADSGSESEGDLHLYNLMVTED